ncbi:DciA family protein [Streptomyces eurocidicus]|uniref:DUF721 domain-containing protein n=1 Tax=Streptomyces eurocidicus TaxID=66423 RepID=A0A7W8F6H0_STREU|nr:DciA family protein [Streptomyces eurocidicus]MBB5123169.1 hypothetical protein [Streptomyces eurocidicus]
MRLSAAIGALVTERAWALPAAGATLRERWTAIAPSSSPPSASTRGSGRPTVCPESVAWVTKARLEQTRVIAAAGKAAGRTTVRALRILPPGSVPTPDPAPVGQEAAAAGPATRETACDGYSRDARAESLHVPRT